MLSTCYIPFYFANTIPSEKKKKKKKNSLIIKFHGIPVLWEQYILKHSMHLKFVSMWPIYFNLDLSAEKKK